MKPLYKGSCLCGAIQYEIDAFHDKIAHCHCSMCRKFHGAAYATIAGVDSDQFRWTQGEAFLKPYTAANGTIRKFCINCGSSMTFSSPKASQDCIEIALGTLDSELDIRPDAHIFVGSKANWSVLCDDMPQYIEDRKSKKIARDEG